MPLNIRNFPSVGNIIELLETYPIDHPARKEWGELMDFIVKLSRTEQGALSVSARRNIAYRIYRSIVEDSEFEPSASDMDYEDEHHERVRKLMFELRSNNEDAS